MKDLETFDLIVTRERSDAAIAFNVADWTNVSSLSGHTNFTGHTRTIIQEAPIASASAQFALQNLGCQARVAVLQYNSSNAKVWAYFPAVVQAGPNNIQLLSVDCTAALNAAYSVASYVYAMAQVKGVGSLYLSRLHITWNKPDFVDWAPAIAGLDARVSTLEQSGGGGGGATSYDDAELRGRVTALEQRMAAAAAALAGA